MEILRVNMRQQSVSREELPAQWEMLGGRALIARILNAEVPPDCDPLGADNRLVIAAGPLAGTMAPQFGRVSIGGKSPLTSGIKESNAGGPAAQKLDKLGVRAVVIEGEPTEGKFYLLKIGSGEATLLPADGYVGMDNYELASSLFKQFGERAALITIGTAGERRYRTAAVCLTDTQGDPSRFAGRGGMGAVMGARGLKAIVIDDSRTATVPLADRDLFQETVKLWVDTIKRDMACGLFSQYGSTLAVNQNSWLGTMVADNYHSGRHEHFQEANGEAIKELNRGRGGRMHGCMPGCVVQCSIMFNDAQGRPMLGALEYEAVAMLGTNLGITDIDGIARLESMCDDIGVDFIEIGSSLGLAAEAGKMNMGDVESAVALLQQVARDGEFGRVLADGVVATAHALGIDRVPAFKGQSIPAHDPRAVKGIGVTYATSPMGADHTAGLTYRRRLNNRGQVENSV
ncbi:MAG: aldehyde ferredoxin oxidoreductase N-terminal domain-containing protein, partial [Chloroflexota bacterium]